jgi:hypothetical protein
MVDEAEVGQALVRGLAGSTGTSDAVVWVKNGDEAVVHLDSITVSLTLGVMSVSVDLETDQTGRAAQEVIIGLAHPAAPASLEAVTTEAPSGNVLLASRWGRTLQDAVWSAVLALADEQAGNGATVGIAAGDGALVVHTRDGAANHPAGDGADSSARATA